MSTGTKSKTHQILAEIRNRRSREKATATEDELVELVFFTLSDRFFACYGVDAKEILPVLKINFIPGAPSHLLGVVNVRGDIESVLDLNRVLGLPPQSRTSKNRIIIAESAGLRSGILTGAVHDVIYVPKNTIHPPLASLAEKIKGYVAGETRYNTSEVTLLNISQIFKDVLAT